MLFSFRGVRRRVLLSFLAVAVVLGSTSVAGAAGHRASLSFSLRPSVTMTAPVTTVTPQAADKKFYVLPNNPAAKAAATYPAYASTFNTIAAQPTAVWLTEQTNLALLPGHQSTATSEGAVPVYVLYAIPGRDCGKYSAGGFASVDQYVAFLNQVKAGIANREAIVIVEPDALPELSVCGLTTTQQQQRIDLIRYAVQTLSSSTVSVYLEGGGAYSNPVSVIAPRLLAAGIDGASGFALNVSAFDSTASEVAYGHALSAAVGNKHFIIDTSRNGVGIPAGTTPGSFCNVANLALGHTPTANTGDSLIDAFLWVKYPGESDGACGNGAPYSGVFFPEYAFGLVERARNLS